MVICLGEITATKIQKLKNFPRLPSACGQSDHSRYRPEFLSPRYLAQAVSALAQIGLVRYHVLPLSHGHAP